MGSGARTRAGGGTGRSSRRTTSTSSTRSTSRRGSTASPRGDVDLRSYLRSLKAALPYNFRYEEPDGHGDTTLQVPEGNRRGRGRCEGASRRASRPPGRSPRSSTT
ncbi:hypothetical protein LV779_13915 [Streptomyces thinghirensis]|nr:hypothetical protein [Streptomyces thinghirensis]